LTRRAIVPLNRWDATGEVVRKGNGGVQGVYTDDSRNERRLGKNPDPPPRSGEGGAGMGEQGRQWRTSVFLPLSASGRGEGGGVVFLPLSASGRGEGFFWGRGEGFFLLAHQSPTAPPTAGLASSIRVTSDGRMRICRPLAVVTITQSLVSFNLLPW
jgi:hypothetical protein